MKKDMEITGKFLLSSAENIVRSRAKDREIAENGEQAAAPAPRESTGIHSRMLSIQSGLNDMQRAYSREQVRHNYLKEHPDEISPDLTFNGKPLFPELKGQQDRGELLRTVEANLGELRSRLKSLQVEMENHLAVEFSSRETMGFDHLDLSVPLAGSRLDPDRVVRLTRQDNPG